MLSPEDTTRTTDSIRSPRPFDHRSAFSEKRQNILQQKQSEKETEALPAVKGDISEQGTPSAKVAWRQVTQLREENRRMRYELDEARGEMQRLLMEHTALQGEFESEVTVIHSGQLQELEQYQGHLQEVMNERNHLQEAYRTMERRYQELYSNFTASVQEESQKKFTVAAQTLVLTPDEVPTELQDAVKTIKLHAIQVEEKQLVEARYLTGEVQRITAQLAEEHSQVEEERQTLLRMQNTTREQAELRYKMVQSHLRSRWTIAFILVTLGALVLLVVLQYVFLLLFHVRLVLAISVSLLAPIVVCIVFAFVFSRPLSTLRHYYRAAPHKKRVK